MFVIYSGPSAKAPAELLEEEKTVMYAEHKKVPWEKTIGKTPPINGQLKTINTCIFLFIRTYKISKFLPTNIFISVINLNRIAILKISDILVL